MSSRRIRTLVDLETDATWTSEVTGSEVIVWTTGKRSRDADTLTRRDWAELGDLRSFSLAVSPDATRVAVAAGSSLLILDAKTGSELATIPLEHVVKGSSVAWDSDHRLTVRTDYGCRSVYGV